MRIYYDHQVFSLHDAGGAPRYFFELIRHLQPSNSLRLEIVLGLTSTVYPFAELANERTKVSAVRSAMRPTGYRYLANEILGFPRDLLRGLVDIYHPTLYRSNPLVKRRRTVVTHHDCTHERYPALFKNSQMVIRNKRRLYQAADAIVCVSESSREDLINYCGIASAKTHVIHHGFAGFTVREDCENHASTVKRPYILFVGNRGTYKNFSTLLDAYRMPGLSADYDLLAVGGGEFSDAEKEYLTRCKLTERVRQICRASEGVLAEAYRGATVFVYPSLYEGFGFPPLEAMSCGCPAIVSNTSSLPEICGDAAIYFDPEDPSELSTKIQAVLGDKLLQNSIRERGYAQVRLYDWNLTAKKTLKVYEDVLDS